MEKKTEEDNLGDQNVESSDKRSGSRLKSGVFMATVTGMSLLTGFGLTVGMAKKSDPTMFEKGLVGSRELPESGASFAARALIRGSIYSCTGFGLVCFAIWKLMGVHSLAEFRQKVGSALPKIPKKDDPGRGDFTTLRDLLEYIIAEDEKAKLRKSRERNVSGEASSSS